MSRDALRHGFREVLRDPALLLIELAWRWTFGILAACIFGLSLFALLDSITVNPQALESLRLVSPVELARTLAASLAALGLALLRVGVLAGLAILMCWTVLSAIGRYATLQRPALASGTRLTTCFAISTARGLVTVLCIVVWLVVTFFAGIISAISAQGRAPNFALVAAILLPTFVLLVVVWSVSNWYLSLAPIFPQQSFFRSAASAWTFTRVQRDEIVEISIFIGVIRAVLFVAAVMLSVAVSAVIANARVLIADLLAISLLYFFCADFLYVARLAAYAKLRGVSEAEVGSAVSVSVTEPIPGT